MCCHSGLAVEGKISAHSARVAEFQDLEDKSDDDHTAIGHLTSVTSYLTDISGLLNARKKRSKRSEGKKNISWVLRIMYLSKNPLRYRHMDRFESKVHGHEVNHISY